jgi:hypothetical protein
VVLEPAGIRHFYTDNWGAYHRHLAPTRMGISTSLSRGQ